MVINSENNTNSDNLNSNNLDNPYEITTGIDKAEQVLSPAFRIIEFDEIMNCPNCHSTDIMKKYDQDEGNYQLKNNQLITRAVVSCKACLKMTFITTSLHDIRKELV